MPKTPRIPKLSLHKPSGCARVRVQGKDLYLGPYGDPETLQRYSRLLAELASQQHQLQVAQANSGQSTPTQDLTISEMILAYLEFATTYYGPRSREPQSMNHALRPLHALYGSTLTQDFGPKSFKAVRQHMIDVHKLSRTEINRRMGRIKRVFKWAVSEELVSPTILHGLSAVSGLRRGRSEAHESRPVRPVDISQIQLTLPFLPPPVAAICQLQLLTGMRPSEVLHMRPCDIDRSGAIWLYTPEHHKTEHLGFEKHVPLGPQAQAVLAPFLNRDPKDYCFTPAEAEAWRNEQRAVHRNPDRKTKIFPCELKARIRRKAKRQAAPKVRQLQPCYDVNAYRRCITYGIRKAQKAGHAVQYWFPYQIRHTHGTEVRRRYGLEAAQVALGHATADVTQVYAERNLKLAMQVAAEIG
ncbi:site-specific tyrosine recombinase XerC [Planctopirus ephydatiae]|uniref:Site-specific tyrosine recombinase XerC n=1 Tax=Planctopirus ephydatiae TaxID=2528019 RepID=A0A518GNP8_9PLAN|nr:site-specific integrase [Planctopirus ephydatiae]QDV30262.1 site-specific tyrosine recombinase XerC [Planctopirus ephydatiae]